MNIIKSNGQKQKFLPNKVLNRIKTQSKNLNIDVIKIFQESISGIVDNMTSKEIDNLIAVTSANMIIDDYDYSYFAARIIISRHGKTIGVEPIDSDYLFDFLGITAFLHKYSMRDDEGNPIELPHMMYKRVAQHLFNEKGEKEVEKQYNFIRWHKISLATPQLMNFGTKQRGSGISCNITTLIDDDTDAILETLATISRSSRDGAGIGLHIHQLRSKDSLVSTFKGTAAGVIRFADMVQSHMRFFKQGNRSGSAALYLGVWHRDIEDFLKLRLPTGDEKMRTRDLFTAVCIPDLFMEKLNSNDDEWYIFCPHEVKKAGFKGLHDTWGGEFKELYNTLVEYGLGKKVSVKEIWSMITKSLVEAGLPYVFYWDNANRNNKQSNISILRGSNLCIEFYGVSNPNYTSQCNLGLIPLHNIEKNDFNEVKIRTRQLVKSLNRAIKVNAWSTDAAKKAGLDQRTIGIGIAGLSDYLQKYNIPYTSDEAKEFNKFIMKTIYETALDESSNLVSEYGTYPSWEGSPYDKMGVKVANSLLVCLMPSASTSALLGVTESFEAPHSNIFVRKVDSGEFTVVNKFLVRKLKDLGLWNDNVKNNIIANQGSIQNIETIPQDIKETFKTIWEIKMKDYIDIAKIRQEFIDQGQSMNLYFPNPTTGKIGGALNHSWKCGLPSGSYYTKTRSALSAPIRLAVDTSINEKPKDSLFDCFGCSA